MVFWRSAGAADGDILKARYCRDTLVQLLRRIASHESRTKPCVAATIVFGWGFFGWVVGGDDYLYESKCL